MKRHIAIAALVLSTATFASADRFQGAQGSSVRVEGTSTLHAWTMQTAEVKGQINAPTPDNWNAPAHAQIVIPVTSLHSEHDKMDKLMAEALKAKSFPEIRFEMTEAKPVKAGADAFVLAAKGKLTIAGVTKDVTFDVRGTKNADGRYTLVGETPLKMTAFGIKPPTAMLNTIRTGDDVKIAFRWVVQRSN